MIFLSVFFFSPSLGNQSLAFCVWAYHSFRPLYLRTGLQYLEEYARVLELRLAVGCCVHRFPSFSLFLHVELRPFRCVSRAHVALVARA